MQDTTETPKALTQWKNEPSLSALKNDFTAARTDHDTRITRINEWIDIRNNTGKEKLPKVNGRSNIHSKLVRKNAEWRYPSLSEPFLNTPSLFEVKPRTAQDTEGALQDKRVLQYQFDNEINKVKLVNQAVQRAVDEGTMALRTGWETKYEERLVEVPSFQYVDHMNIDPVGALGYHEELRSLKEMLSPEDYEAQIPEQDRRAHTIFERYKGNRLPIPVPNGTRKVKKPVQVVNRPTLEVTDLRNLYVDPTCKGDYTKAQFFINVYETSISDLKAQGKRYSNLDKIPIDSSHPDLDAEYNQDDDNEGSADSDFKFQDDPRKKILVYEYWGNWDIDNNGITKPIVAEWVGGVLIRLEENPFPHKKAPFDIVNMMEVRDSIYGEPDAELLADNQRIEGALSRGIIDIIGRSANGQRGMPKNFLDPVNKRKFNQGNHFEYNPSSNVAARDAMVFTKMEEVPQSAFFFLNKQSEEAEGLSGNNLFGGGVSNSTSGTPQTAGGVASADSKVSIRNTSLLRKLNAGLVEAAKKIIAMNAVWLDEGTVIRITDNEYIEYDPSKAAAGYDVSITVSTAEEETKKAGDITFMLQTLGNTVPFEVTKRLLAEQARLRHMPALAEDLMAYEPQPDPLQEAKVATEQAKAQEAMARAQYYEAQRLHIEQGKISLDQAKAKEANSKADMLDLEYVHAESGVEHARSMDLMSAQADAQGRFKIDEAIVKSTLDTDSKAATRQ